MPTGATRADVEATPYLDQDWLRDLVETLASIHRPTASAGERRAAEWLLGRLREMGADGEIEVEDVHGTYWWPLGIAAGAGAVAGVAALRGRRVLGAAIAAAAAAAIADEAPPHGRRLRRLLPRRNAFQVVATMGSADAERTIVVLAHHDAAHAGLLFHPAIPELADRLGFIERSDTSPPLLAPVLGGPAAVAAGTVMQRRWLIWLGTVLSAGSAAALANIGSRETVPGANDNATAVAALIALARAIAEQPVENLRVMFVSTSEEALCEGMQAFAERHFDELPLESTFFLCLETLGSPNLLVLRGEGMLRMNEYPSAALTLLDGLAEELGIWLFPNLRLRNATDGVFPLAAGYQCAALCSCTDLKQPGNYHWPTDTPENVDYGTLADAVRLTEAVVRRLDQDWL
jgi:peptidase M28-like protein